MRPPSTATSSGAFNACDGSTTVPPRNRTSYIRADGAMPDRKTAGMEAPTTDDRAIWDLWLSQYQLPVVLAADELGIFECLRDGPASLEELSHRLGLFNRSAAALTAALSATGYLVQQGGRFHLTQT